jgi:hypothetical protein
MATTYLLVVAAAIFVCCLSIMTSTIRLAFGMARDNQLPLSSQLAKVSPTLHTPIGACIAVGLLAAVPLLQYAGAAYIAIAATGMIYTQLPPGEHRHAAGAPGGMAAGQGAVQPGPVGHHRQHPGAPVGRRHAGQLRLPSRVLQSPADRDHVG